MFLRKLGETQNISQRLIQLVRDPCGKLADRRQSVGVAKLLLEALLILIRPPPLDNQRDLPRHSVQQASLFT
jgi:hypothetical protein